MKHNAPTTDVTHTDLAHESAVKHVTGRANYTDDIAEPPAHYTLTWACQI